jgi:hypothetical protein
MDKLSLGGPFNNTWPNYLSYSLNNKFGLHGVLAGSLLYLLNSNLTVFS